MTRDQALPYIAYVLDDGLSPDHSLDDLRDDARLIGWQCGFEPVFVAVQSYLPGVRLDDDEAIEIAQEYLAEIGWFNDRDGGAPSDPDFII